MKNYKQRGENITVPAPGNITSGSLVVVGAMFGVAEHGALSGEPVTITTGKVFVLPKVATDVVAIGAKVYWDAGDNLTTVTSTDNLPIGVAIAAAGNPSGSVAVRLNPSF